MAAHPPPPPPPALAAPGGPSRGPSGSQQHQTGLWVFGYGSLCWNPGFEFERSCIGFIRGYQRRFSQGNTFHRGTSDKPGRVATLTEDKDGVVWGRAFLITGEAALQYLAERECKIGGYKTVLAPVFTLRCSSSTDPSMSETELSVTELEDTFELDLSHPAASWHQDLSLSQHAPGQDFSHNISIHGSRDTVRIHQEMGVANFSNKLGECSKSFSAKKSKFSDTSRSLSEKTLERKNTTPPKAAPKKWTGDNLLEICTNDLSFLQKSKNESQNLETNVNRSFSDQFSREGMRKLSLTETLKDFIPSKEQKRKERPQNLNINPQYKRPRENSLSPTNFTHFGFSENDFEQVTNAAIIYIATPDNEHWLGDDLVPKLAHEICNTSGKSGHNIDYVLNLAKFVRENCPFEADFHLFELESEILKLSPNHECKFYEKLDIQIRQPEIEVQQQIENQNHMQQEFSKRVPSKKLRCLNI